MTDLQDAYSNGWKSAHDAYMGGVDIWTHASQGDTDFDRGWNNYIDWIESLARELAADPGLEQGQ